MNTINAKKLSIGLLKSGLFLFVLLLIQAAANAQERASYDGNTYVEAGTNNWRWNGGTTRTIYNPLDGGVFMKYTMTSQGNSDGCSGPSQEREKKLFREACFAHDTNYDAPFELAGFPKYPSGGSSGNDIADYIFYKDMQLINNNARAKNDGATNWINDSAADVFYTGVVLANEFRGYSTGKSILAKGGVIAVVNNGAYVMKLKVSWNGPDGVARSVEITKPVGQTAVVPLSVGATNIKAEAWAVAGTTIFTKSIARPGMFAFTVKGTTLIHSAQNGLENNARNNFYNPATERTIKFFNQAGYVAYMSITYFVNQNIGGVNAAMPKVAFSDKITAGVTKVIAIPKDLAPNTKINVTIRGVGTIKGEVFSTTVEPNFTGQKCFKAWGTIFDAQGGGC